MEVNLLTKTVVYDKFTIRRKLPLILSEETDKPIIFGWL